MKKAALTLTLAILLSACGTSFTVQPGDSAVMRLKKGGTTYVALPEDGVYDGQVHTSSGFHTAQAAAEALLTYTDPVAAKATETVSGALRSAAHYNCDYLYYIIIENWEPRRAAFSGRATRIRLRVNVYDVASSALVMNKVLEVTGRSVTIRSQKAEDLVYSLFQENISSFYQ